MSSATLQRPTGTRKGDPGRLRIALFGVAGGASAAVAGVLVTVGLSLVVWAVTPSAADPVGLMRAGVTAFAAGNGADIAVGDSVLTLSPLLLGVFGWALLWQAVVRTPQPPVGVPRQVVLAVGAGLTYGAVVVLAAALFGTSGSLVAGSLWAPVAVAILVATLAVLRLSTDTRDRWRAALADHWVVGFRLAAVGGMAVVGLGALTLTVGLVLSFGQAVGLTGATVGPGFGDGLGLLLLGLAYLPNVIVGAVGYATGAGVQLGDATFGPFGSTVAELPAIPVLAALPDSTGGALGLAALLLPVLAGGLLGRAAAARLGDLRSRWIAVGTAAALVGAGTAFAALLAAGGVSGGAWAHTGVPAWSVGLLLALELAVAGGLVALLVPRTAVVGERPPSLRARLAARRAAAGSDDAAVGAAAAEVDDTPGDEDATSEDSTSQDPAGEGGAGEPADVHDSENTTADTAPAEDLTAEDAPADSVTADDTPVEGAAVVSDDPDPAAAGEAGDPDSGDGVSPQVPSEDADPGPVDAGDHVVAEDAADLRSGDRTHADDTSGGAPEDAAEIDDDAAPARPWERTDDDAPPAAGRPDEHPAATTR